MAEPMGLRERKKLQQRDRLADVAAVLFADRGYDEVSVADIARSADVSDQTVYNYFPAKPDLVLDRADLIREQYRIAVRERGPDVSPAAAITPMVLADIERFRGSDPSLARGQFPALCVQSVVLRRFALEFRALLIDSIAEAIQQTRPDLNPLIVQVHAAALVWVVHTLTERIGGAVLLGDVSGTTADAMRRDALLALDDLDRHYASSIPEVLD